MLLFVWLSAIIPILSACVDLLFVVDPQDEPSVGRSVKIANELGHRGLFLSVITKKNSHFLSITAKNKADLIELLHNVRGTYDELLGAVTKKIARRKVERPLIVLLFAENDVPRELTDSWKEMKNSTLHIFRVGASKNREIIRNHEGVTFDQLISCAKRSHSRVDIRRRGPSLASPQNSTLGQNSTNGMTTAGATKRHPIFKGTKTPGTITNEAQPKPRTAVSTSTLRAVPIRVRNRFERKGPEQSGEIQKSTTRMVVHSTTSRPIPYGCTVDIIFLVDFSKGTGEKSQSYFDLAATAVGVLPIGPDTVRVALLGYSGPGRATALFHLDKHESKDDLIEELFRMEQHGGTTRTAEAIRFANKEFGNSRHGARKGAKKVIVLFTDGYSQDDPSPAAEEARRDGVKIVTVSVSDRLSPDKEVLEQITGNKDLVLISPSGHLIRDKVLGRGCNL